MLTFGSLFSGAGGMDLGLEMAGLRCAWQVEIDKTARSVLARHWPTVERFEDVRTVGRKQLLPVDVLVGGFPCQDLSVAGARKGLDGERSGLFYELARIARELRPRILIWENVPGLLSSDGGRDFLRVVWTLAECGYRGCYRTLDAEGFGVAQHRRRVFGAFALGRVGAERGAEILALTESVRRDTPKGGKAGADVAGTLGGGTPGRGWSDDFDRAGAFIASDYSSGGYAESNVSSPITQGSDRSRGTALLAFGGNDTRGPRRPAAGLNGHSSRQDFESETFIVNSATSEAKEQHARRVDVARSLDTTGGFASGQGGTVVVGQCHGNNVGPVGTLRKGNGNVTGGIPFLTTGQGVRRMTPRECERIMGWPDDHTRYRADGSEIADGPRYRMIGNGVVAPIATWIGRRLIGAAA